MNVLLTAALLPAVLLMVYVYRKDTVEREPIGLVLRVCAIGAVMGPIAGIVESFLFDLFEIFIPAGPLLIVVEYFIGVAMVEEGCKYAALNTIRTNPEFNYVFDAIVYSVAAALGFAALENVFYVMDYGLEVAFTRAIFSVPGHAADGVIMGVFYGIARQHEVAGRTAKSKTFYRLAFILPVIEHGFYDAALSFDSDMLALAAIAVDLVFIFIAFLLVRKVSRNDKPIAPMR